MIYHSWLLVVAQQFPHHTIDGEEWYNIEQLRIEPDNVQAKINFCFRWPASSKSRATPCFSFADFIRIKTPRFD